MILKIQNEIVKFETISKTKKYIETKTCANKPRDLEPTLYKLKNSRNNSSKNHTKRFASTVYNEISTPAKQVRCIFKLQICKIIISNFFLNVYHFVSKKITEKNPVAIPLLIARAKKMLFFIFAQFIVKFKGKNL